MLGFFSCKELEPPRRLSAKLERTFPDIDISPLEGRSCYLDTFDWRVYRRGWALEAIIEQQAGGGQNIQLVWRDPNSKNIHGIAWLDTVPVFSEDLPKGGHWARLGGILAVRALMPIACNGIRGRRMVLRNGQNQAVVTMELRLGDDGGRIRITGVHGFEKAFGRAADIVKSRLGCKELKRDPARRALEGGPRKPGAYRPKPRIGRNASARTDETCKGILLHLLDVMGENESGIRRQIDTEFLHDFRIAVRRGRSLLGQIKAVFPEPDERRFRCELAWLQGVTGPVRDGDVQLLDFPELQAQLPTDDQRRDLLPMREFLLVRRREAYENLLEAFDSDRYRAFVRDWRAFLEAPVPPYPPRANAAKPVAEVASRRIRRLFRQAIREGKTITDASPAEDLHELRKTCKKLRYLLEFFDNLFPRKRIDTLIKTLKVLQDNLGAYQDLQVQRESLAELEGSMRERDLPPEATFRAMATLAASLAERERRVRNAFSARFEFFSAKDNRKRFEAVFRPSPKGKKS